MKLALYKKIMNKSSIGPGGINCVCCGPAPGKERKKFFKTGRDKLKVETKKEIEESLNNA